MIGQEVGVFKDAGRDILSDDRETADIVLALGDGGPFDILIEFAADVVGAGGAGGVGVDPLEAVAVRVRS